ncbi:MAG: hypothetical protein RLZZ137_2116 [Cyanobacteriota bacterium]|jgi:hypothetical protein
MARVAPRSVGTPLTIPMLQTQPRVFRWIKTPCGRARYVELAARPGVWARLRLAWFVLIAALRDLDLPDAPQ